MRNCWTAIFLWAIAIPVMAGDEVAIELPALRALIADWTTRVSSFSGQFTEHVQHEAVSTNTPEKSALEPIVVDFLWSSTGWYDKCAHNGVNNVIYDGKTTTYFSQNNAGVANAVVSAGEGLPHSDFPMFLLQKRMPLAGMSVQSLLENEGAESVEIDGDHRRITLQLHQNETATTFSMQFSRDKGWLLDDYSAVSTRRSAKTKDLLTDEFRARFDTWADFRDELTGTLISIPTRVVATWTTDGLLASTSTKEVRNLQINPHVPKSAFQIEFPIGTHVRRESVPGKPGQRFIVGGDAAITKETERQEELIKQSIAAVAARGIQIRAAPEPSGLVSVMTLMGGALLLCAGLLRWKKYHYR